MPTLRGLTAAACTLALLTACTPPSVSTEPSTPSADSAKADAVMRIVRDAVTQSHLNAAIVRVTVDGQEVVTEAVGDSMTGVPATPAMHFRNGAVAISYVATLLLQLAEEGTVGLDDKLSTWLPEVPHSDEVTLRQLAQMTSGYVDYVIGNTAMNDALFADPFRAWSTHDLLEYATSKPLLYEPGTNWNYAHTNYLLLGMALEKATGENMSELLSDKVLRPLGLTNTVASLTAEIPSPVLHAFTSERRQALEIPSATPFYEESTFWSPSWTITHGAIQTTNIYDLEATAVGIGSGRLLRPESHEKMVSTELRGKARAQPGCTTCMEMTEGYTYGLGVVISGNWLLQNPMFAGYAAVEAYLPSQKIAIAVATTFAPEAFDEQGDYSNAAEALFREIGAEMAPDDAPPMPPAEIMVPVAPKVLFLRNEHLATEALLGEAFIEHGFDVDTFEVVPAERVHDPAGAVTFPDPAGYDVIVPLGATWPVYDDALRRTWVGDEMQLLRDAAEGGTALLGVCFGGQLLAQTFGGAVSPSPYPEIGWYEVASDRPDIVPGGPWFQWHFDRWTLPPGATEIARTANASQAFVLGRTMGLQFHPEVDADLLKIWLAADCTDDVVTAGLTHDELITRTQELAEDTGSRIRRLVGGFLNHVAGQPLPS